MIPQLHFWVDSKELKVGSQKGVCKPIFNRVLFTAAKGGSIQSQMNGYTYTMKYYSAF